MKKIISTLLAVCISVTVISQLSFAQEDGDIVIIYTNDTRCEVDGDLGFADISAIEAIETAKGNDVIIVDAGDAVQGGAIGSLSKGEYIIRIMNEVGYDVAAIGNHEFDYDMDRFKELSKLAEYPYVCSNLISLETNKPMFEPYHVISIGDIDIAFVGVTTPHTFTSSAPDYFKDTNGDYIYDFSGENLFDVVQDSIDMAISDGADVIVAVTHMGVDDADLPYTSKELISKTDGINVVIDAHSHTIIEHDTYKNIDGKDVLLTSSGTKFANIGTIRISQNGEISSELIDKEYKFNLLSGDAKKIYDEKNEFIEDIKQQYSEALGKVIAVSEYDLTIYDPFKFNEETGAYREVRRGETNMGDLCADAYRSVLACDVAIINGGGVRADIKKGEVRFGDVLNVNPFGNELCVIEVTGKQLLDALEHGARSYPLEEGAFLQVSGLTYEIDHDTQSSVVLDDKGMFSKVLGERRVKNVKVSDVPIDETKIYTLGGSAYTLINGGDGFSMFSGAKIVNNSVCTDCDALMTYIADDLNGVIGEAYADPHGDGRIKVMDAARYSFTDTQMHWARESIDVAVGMGIVNGITDTTFEPNSNITRAMFATILYRMANSPNSEDAHEYKDVSYDAYYTDAVAWARANNIMTGMDKFTFEPDELITREQMASAIMRYCTYMGKGPVGAWAIRLDYADLDEAADWAIEAMMFTKMHNIMTGDDKDKFNPKYSVTRAEATVSMLRVNGFIIN